jgi:hypothetical protein
MKKSPQGTRMSDSEDENGATKDDVMNTTNK